MMCLPNVNHLVAEGLADFNERILGEILGIYRQFINILALLIYPTANGGVPHYLTLAVVGNDDFWKLLVKELSIKIIVCF